MAKSEAFMKMKTGAMVFLLAASAAFAQTEDETPPMLPLPEVLQIATDLQAAELARIVAELRNPCDVVAASFTNATELGGGGPLRGPLYVTPMAPVPKKTYVPKNAPDTLQMYIDLANPGDELIVAPGTYDMGGRQLNQEGPATRQVIEIDKPLTLRSEQGPANTMQRSGGGANNAQRRGVRNSIECGIAAQSDPVELA
jgi:hypothetical protein